MSNLELEKEIADAMIVDGKQPNVTGGTIDPTVGLDPAPTGQAVKGTYDFTKTGNELKSGFQYHFFQTFPANDKLTIYVNIDVKVYETAVATFINFKGSDQVKYNSKVTEPSELELYGAPIKDKDGGITYFKKIHNDMQEFLKWVEQMVAFNGKLSRSKMWQDTKEGKVQVWFKPLAKENKEESSPKLNTTKPQETKSNSETTVSDPKPITGRIRHRSNRTINKFYITGGQNNFNFK